MHVGRRSFLCAWNAWTRQRTRAASKRSTGSIQEASRPGSLCPGLYPNSPIVHNQLTTHADAQKKKKTNNTYMLLLSIRLYTFSPQNRTAPNCRFYSIIGWLIFQSQMNIELGGQISTKNTKYLMGGVIREQTHDFVNIDSFLKPNTV